MSNLSMKERMAQKAAKRKKEKNGEDTVSTPNQFELNLNNRHTFELVTDKKLNTFLIEEGHKLYTNEVNSHIKAGEILHNVFNELSGNNQYDGLYMAWLKVIEYNPRTALRHRIRYELYKSTKNKEIKELYATLPVRLLEKLHGHSEKNYFLSLIENKEIKNKKDLEGYLESDILTENNPKAKPITPFYKPIFTFEKKIGKMTSKESHKALEELREVKKEINRLEKILKSKEES